MPFCRVTSPGNIKGRANHSRPLFASSLNSSRTDNLFPLSPQQQSPEHYEESISNLWTIGLWETIFSSFIFPSKLTDPRRNKLDIFNSCFDFSILIPVPTTASQLLLCLQRLNAGSVIYNHFPLPATYSTSVIFLAVIKLIETHQYSRPHSSTSFLLYVTRQTHNLPLSLKYKRKILNDII